MGYKRLDSMLEGFCDTYGSAVAWIRNNTIGIIERSKKYEGLEEKHGPGLEDKLTQHGIYPGDCVRVLREAPMGGPLLVDVHGREIALGRGVAKKIFVDEDKECE